MLNGQWRKCTCKISNKAQVLKLSDGTKLYLRKDKVRWKSIPFNNVIIIKENVERNAIS